MKILYSNIVIISDLLWRKTYKTQPVPIVDFGFEYVVNKRDDLFVIHMHGFIPPDGNN